MLSSLIETFQLFILSVWLQIYKRRQLYIVAKEAIWRPFCLCKLDGQDLKISLTNRAYRIQHTQNRLKSLVPCFYPKMLLTLTFSRNPTRLQVIVQLGSQTFSYISEMFNSTLTLRVPENLQLYGLYVHYVVHVCDFGLLRVEQWVIQWKLDITRSLIGTGMFCLLCRILCCIGGRRTVKQRRLICWGRRG